MSIRATVRAWNTQTAPEYKLILLDLAESNLGDTDGSGGNDFIIVKISATALATGYTEDELVEYVQQMIEVGILDGHIRRTTPQVMMVRYGWDEGGATQ